jgi:hypothetical protein
LHPMHSASELGQESDPSGIPPNSAGLGFEFYREAGGRDIYRKGRETPLSAKVVFHGLAMWAFKLSRGLVPGRAKC